MIKAIEEGKAAYFAGNVLTDNPYVLPNDSTAWFDWATGWHMSRSLHEAKQKRPGHILWENF